MVITEELIDKLADLSMLTFSDEEKVRLQSELEKMVGFFGKLEEINTDGIEPLQHMSESLTPMREDVINGEISGKNAFKNAGKHSENFFVVPKVIKK